MKEFSHKNYLHVVNSARVTNRKKGTMHKTNSRKEKSDSKISLNLELTERDHKILGPFPTR